MRRKKITIAIIILIVTLIVAFMIKIKSEKEGNAPINEKAINEETIDGDKEKKSTEEVQDNEFQKVNSNVINIKYKGYYLSPLVTIAEEKSEFEVNITEGKDINSITIINSTTGEMKELEKKPDGKFTIKTSLEKEVEYGILLDNRLAGSIRVVENIEEVDGKALFEEILLKLQCGF